LRRVNVLAHSDTPGISDPPTRMCRSGLCRPTRRGVEGSPPVATVSSKAIMAAVEQAFSTGGGRWRDTSSRRTLLPSQWKMVRIGPSADGFGGELVIDVTVEGGKITDIEVVESQETPFIARYGFQRTGSPRSSKRRDQLEDGERCHLHQQSLAWKRWRRR